MAESAMAPATNWVAALNRFLRPPPPVEHCELCGQVIRSDHPHLIEPHERRLLCACVPCALLFEHEDGQYRRVPQHVYRLDDFQLSDPQWESLGIPIDLAFFHYRGSDERVVALYPGPAGTTESLVEVEVWNDLWAVNPVLGELQADVEALLINRANGTRDYFRVPIDRCYVLVGLIRRHWRGLSGGTEVWKVIRDYFAWLKDAPDTLGDWGAFLR